MPYHRVDRWGGRLAEPLAAGPSSVTTEELDPPAIVRRDRQIPASDDRLAAPKDGTWRSLFAPVRAPAPPSLITRHSSLLLLFFLLLSSCTRLGDLIPRPLPDVVKIGLSAPFEGTYRYIGYDAIYAARLAVREINEGGGIDGWRLELVAYDDRGEEAVAEQVATSLVVDSDVIVVIGHYLPRTSSTAGAIYAEGGLPHLVIGESHLTAGFAWHLTPSSPQVVDAKEAAGADLAVPPYAAVGTGIVVGTETVTPYPRPQDLAGTQDWTASYKAMGPHVPEPGPYALPTYEAVYIVAETLSTLLGEGDRPNREMLGDAMGRATRDGWLGLVEWAEDHYWASMPFYHYRWTDDGFQLVGTVP